MQTTPDSQSLQFVSGIFVIGLALPRIPCQQPNRKHTTSAALKECLAGLHRGAGFLLLGTWEPGTERPVKWNVFVSETRQPTSFEASALPLMDKPLHFCQGKWLSRLWNIVLSAARMNVCSEMEFNSKVEHTLMCQIDCSLVMSVFLSDALHAIPNGFFKAGPESL